MTIFTIDEQNQIRVFANQEEAAVAMASPFTSFANEQELAELAGAWPSGRLMEVWNSLPGVTPVKKFRDTATAVHRIWSRIQKLGEPAAPQTQEPVKPRAERKAKGGAHKPKGKPAKAKATKKASPAQAAPKAKKALASGQGKPAGIHGGTKTAQVIALLQRKNGATLAEIMEKMDWQKHTVRGFMAGAMRKAGYAVESFKPEGGERTYRLPVK